MAPKGWRRAARWVLRKTRILEVVRVLARAGCACSGGRLRPKPCDRAEAGVPSPFPRSPPFFSPPAVLSRAPKHGAQSRDPDLVPASCGKSYLARAKAPVRYARVLSDRAENFGPSFFS